MGNEGNCASLAICWTNISSTLSEASDESIYIVCSDGEDSGNLEKIVTSDIICCMPVPESESVYVAFAYYIYLMRKKNVLNFSAK